MVNIKIYGDSQSSCTRRVLLVCKELGLRYDLVPVNLREGGHKNPDYVEKMQPFGAIPALEDTDGTKIYESRAIARYLTAKYGKDSSLLPAQSDVVAYGLFEQAASIEYSSFDPPSGGLIRERFVNPMYGFPTSKDIENHYESLLKTRLEGYERVLSKQKYLAGDHITLADLFHLPSGQRLYQLDSGLIDSKPNLKRWWNEISSRESWKALN